MRSAVRPAVTIAMTIGILAGFATGQISAEAFLNIASVVITFWFVRREDEKRHEENK